MKILIVDDETLDLFISKKLLSLDYDVTGFCSVSETIDWAKENNFDIVLIDYYLGTGLHAPQVLQQLIALKQKSFKAFVLSNHVDENQMKELKNFGFDGVIFKPLSLERFKEVIQ